MHCADWLMLRWAKSNARPGVAGSKSKPKAARTSKPGLRCGRFLINGSQDAPQPRPERRQPVRSG